MARTAKPGSGEEGTPPPKTNVTDETITRHVNICAAAKSDLESAQGEYRAALKSAKSAGLSTRAITWYLAAKKREADDIIAEMNERARIANVMELLPHGTQLDMFEPISAERVLQEVDGEASDAEAEGFDAYDADLSSADNPHPAGSVRAFNWASGWERHRDLVAQRVGQHFTKRNEERAR